MSAAKVEMGSGAYVLNCSGEAFKQNKTGVKLLQAIKNFSELVRNSTLFSLSTKFVTALVNFEKAIGSAISVVTIGKIIATFNAFVQSVRGFIYKKYLEVFGIGKFSSDLCKDVCSLAALGHAVGFWAINVAKFLRVGAIAGAFFNGFDIPVTFSSLHKSSPGKFLDLIKIIKDVAAVTLFCVATFTSLLSLPMFLFSSLLVGAFSIYVDVIEKHVEAYDKAHPEEALGKNSR